MVVVNTTLYQLIQQQTGSSKRKQELTSTQRDGIAGCSDCDTGGKEVKVCRLTRRTEEEQRVVVQILHIPVLNVEKQTNFAIYSPIDGKEHGSCHHSRGNERIQRMENSDEEQWVPLVK
jgi:hypothetical protein